MKERNLWYIFLETWPEANHYNNILVLNVSALPKVAVYINSYFVPNINVSLLSDFINYVWARSIQFDVHVISPGNNAHEFMFFSQYMYWLVKTVISDIHAYRQQRNLWFVHCHAEMLKSNEGSWSLNWNQQWRQAINTPAGGIWKKTVLFYGFCVVLCQGSNWISMNDGYKGHKTIKLGYIFHGQCFCMTVFIIS